MTTTNSSARTNSPSWVRHGGMREIDRVGMSFQPLTRSWRKSHDTDVNYLMAARKEGYELGSRLVRFGSGKKSRSKLTNCSLPLSSPVKCAPMLRDSRTPFSSSRRCRPRWHWRSPSLSRRCRSEAQAGAEDAPAEDATRQSNNESRPRTTKPTSRQAEKSADKGSPTSRSSSAAMGNGAPTLRRAGAGQDLLCARPAQGADAESEAERRLRLHLHLDAARRKISTTRSRSISAMRPRTAPPRSPTSTATARN